MNFYNNNYRQTFKVRQIIDPKRWVCILYFYSSETCLYLKLIIEKKNLFKIARKIWILTQKLVWYPRFLELQLHKHEKGIHR